MFYHMKIAAREEYEYGGNTFELVVYRSEEEGHLRGYISSGGFSDRIVAMSGETAGDMKMVTGDDPVAMLISVMKNEIDAGKFPLPSNT